jgi:hypothetical protein
MIKRQEIEHLQMRAIAWRLIIDMMKIAHDERLPGHPFGPEITLGFVYGAAIISIAKGAPVRATTIARYLQLPRETVRRHLGRLVKLKLLEKNNGTFSAGEQSRAEGAIERAVKMIQEGAAKLL